MAQRQTESRVAIYFAHTRKSKRWGTFPREKTSKKLRCPPKIVSNSDQQLHSFQKTKSLLWEGRGRGRTRSQKLLAKYGRRCLAAGRHSLFSLSRYRARKHGEPRGPDKRGPRNFAASDKLACHTAALVPDCGNIFIERLAANGNPGVPSPALFSSTRLSLSGPRDRCSFFSFYLFIRLSLSLSFCLSRGDSFYLASTLENKVNKYKRGHYQIMAWLLTAIHFTTYVTRLAAWRPWIYRRLNSLSRESCVPAQRCSALIRFENAPQFTRACSRTSPFLFGACCPEETLTVGLAREIKMSGNNWNVSVSCSRFQRMSHVLALGRRGEILIGEVVIFLPGKCTTRVAYWTFRIFLV